MAASGAQLLPPMPDFSSNDPFSTSGYMKLHLQGLLDSKEKQLQQAGSFGQRVLAQQMELEERIRQIQDLEADKGEDEEVDNEARERYRELADTLLSWDEENVQLSSAFGNNTKVFLNGNAHSPTIPYADLREEPERVKPSVGSSAAQSRRAKNAAHRADDVEFAFEIGSGLLTEVRRLQSLLGERDKAIQDMKEEKDDLERIVETLRTTIRQNDKMIDELRSSNWDLEVSVRELQTQLTESQSSVQRLESEHKRLTKSLTAARDTGDQHKNEIERLQTIVEEMKGKHETDVAQARKHAAGLARDKSDLQQTIDTMKAEAARAARRIPRFGSPLTPGGGSDQKDFLTPAHDGDGESDVFGTTGRASTNRRNVDIAGLFPLDDLADIDNSPEPSPVRKTFLAANHPSNEIEALQQRLAHAQRQVNTLKGSLNREKQLRMRLEGVSGVTPQDEEDEEDDYVDEDTAVTENKKVVKRVTPFKVGRGRGRGRGITLMQRFAAATSASDYQDEDEENFESPPPVPPIPSQESQDEEEDEVSQFFGSSQDHDQDELMLEERRSPSPPPINSNRTSVDGMDPVFANVLRRVPSNGSSYAGSPLRQAVLGRSARNSVGRGRRPRGGVPFKAARPPSITDAPEVLATELSGMGSPFKANNTSLLNDADVIEEDDEYIRVRKVERVEFGCQTDLAVDETVPEPPAVNVAAVQHAEIGIQSEPEPEPVQTTTAEMGMQTVLEPTPVVKKSEVATQHSPRVATPVRVSSGVGTDSIPEESGLIRRRLPPLIIADKNRRATITQADLSRGDSLGGDTTVKQARSFLVDRPTEEDEDELDDGEETETGADTEDDYQDARQSIHASTPSDYHSMLTVTENYSDSEDDTESVKASQFSMRDRSTTSINHQPSFSSYHSKDQVPTTSYESVGVGADLYEPPSPIIVETPILPPKPEVKEISIQTDDWKPPVVPASPVPKSPTLIRVGSGGHQFQFVPPSPANASGPLSAPVFTAPSPAPTTLSSIFREPSISLGRRITASDRRQSIDSIITSGTGVPEDAPVRSRVPSSAATSILLNSADKSKPPILSLPPPPKAPPPNSMPPPNFIPDKRTISDGPPPRPSSPPPPDLIQRATTPLLGSVLNIPGNRSVRIQGSSLPPSQTNIRQLPSTSSFRSANHAASHASIPPSSTYSSYNGKERERKDMSTISLTSDIASPRSSLSSDHHLPYDRPSRADEPSTPNKTADITPRANDNQLQATDPTIIHAITQTMIGEFMWKYTRKAIGKGVGERRHKRFFWVHPYTKTLYWSSADPGSSNVSESSAKSAYIEGVRSVLDPNPMPPGLYQYSVVVSTPHRDMKITAQTKDRHDIWLNALKYLLARPTNPTVTSPGNATILPQTPGSATDDERRLVASPQSQRSPRSALRGETWNSTPRGKRSRSQLSVGGSVSKRTGTPAVEYLRWNAPESPYSPEKSFVNVPGQDTDELDFELHNESMSEEAFEGLENVRACCDGRHTVGHSKQHHHHHHHHHHNAVGTISSRRSVDNQHLDPSAPEHARPSSPAWSFRSRTGSSHGHGEGGGLFSWGRGEDGKLRFGSRRSVKASIPAHD